MPDIEPPSPIQIARDVHDFYLKDPAWVISLVEQRMVAINDYRMLNIFNSTHDITNALPRKRALEKAQIEQAFKEGFAIAYLYYDTLSITQGMSLKPVKSEQFAIASVPFRHNLRLIHLAKENLIKSEVDEIIVKRLAQYREAIPFPLRHCANQIVQHSPVFILKPESGHYFMGGVMAADSLLR